MKAMKSRKETRQDGILAALEANPALRVSALARAMGVSTETIRRDLTELDGRGRLSRTYGGAVSAARRFEPALADRLRLSVSERQAIAAAAVEAVAEEPVLLLGGGATMVQFARALCRASGRLTVITPSYPIARELSGNPLIEIVLLPGTFEAQEQMVCGPDTIRAVERYRAPVAVMGASGIAAEGISEAMLRAGEVYSAMLDSAGRAFILADHGKFGKRALMLLTGWRPGLTLLADRPPPAGIAGAMATGGAELQIAAPQAVAAGGVER